MKTLTNQKLFKCAGVMSLIGIPAFILFGFLEYVRYESSLAGWFLATYIIVNIIILFVEIIYFLAMKLLSLKTSNRMLYITNNILIILIGIFYIQIILELISPSFRLFILSDTGVLIGLIPLVIWGVVGLFAYISILKLKPYFGKLATAIGVLGIIMSVGLMSVLFTVLVFVLIIPISILTSILFFKAAKQFSN